MKCITATKYKTTFGKFSCNNLLVTTLASSLLFYMAFANADEHMHDNKYVHDHGDNPIITKIMLDQVEVQDTADGNTSMITAQTWIGKDLDKLWLKVDLERQHGEMEKNEVQALYSHAIASYWEMQIGLRKDTKPSTRTWGVIGIQGLAPYFFDIDAAIFAGEAGDTAVRISAEYDLLFTQRLILSPEIEFNAYGQNDQEFGTGSGLSDINAGLRLRYEIHRELAPYIGINWSKKFGKTADFSRHKNETISDTTWVMGLRVWF